MSISRKFQRSKSKYTLSQKIISAVTAAGFIMQPFTAFAGEIIKPGGNNLINDKVANIWADKVVGNAAVNVFDKFNLSANEIANMYFGTSKENHNAANLVNFVNDRIDINGTVNAIQNNKIGGNLFFLSKEGMAVGKSGVINTGSLYVMTPVERIYDITSPEHNYSYEALKGTFDSGSEANINTALNRMQALNIPLNASGTISVLGKVNATGDVKMAAAKIGIGKNVSGEIKDEVTGEVMMAANAENADAYIKTVVKNANGETFNFADLVNIKDVNGNVVTNAGLGSDLTAVESGNGDIVLAAKAEYANTLDQTFNEIGNALGLTGVDVPKTIEASIESYGTITARGNAELTAEATNGNKDLAEEVLKQTTDLGTKIPDYVPVPAADAGNYAQTVAKVEVQGDITAGQDIKVAANADNTYVDNGQGIEDNVSNILQYITPVNANVMILGSKAEVNIGENADLTAEGVIDVTANSVLDGTAGAAVNGRKLVTVSTVSQAGSFLPSAAVGYADVENSAKVNIQGNLTAKGANKINENGETEKAVNIAAYAEESVANTANLNISSTTTKPNSSLIAAAVAVTESSNTADVIIGSGSSVNAANGDVDITADTVNLLNTNAASVAPDNTVGAAAVNVFSHDGHANIAIDGDITGRNVAIDATNLIDENTITANNELGMGKIQAQLVNAIDPDGLKNAVKNNQIVKDITTNIKNALGSSSSGDGGKTDITQVLSDKFEAGAAVVVTNENNSANVTFGKTAYVTAKYGDITADADVRVVDYSFTASGTSNSYKKSAADGSTTTVTVGAGVVYAGMDNEASVVFADGDGSGEEQHAELTAAGNINVISSNIMEYNRPQRIIREIQRSIENIEYAIAAFDKLDEYQQQGMEEYRNGLKNLKQSLESYIKNYSNDFTEAVKNPDAITAEGTMNKIYEMAAAAAVLYNNVVTLQTKYNTVQGSNEFSAASAIISNSLAVVTNALAFADPNNYANVAAQASAKGGSESSKFAASGSVAVSDFSGTSGVKIGKYTKLEAGKDLNLESANEIEDVTITGKTMFWTNNADAKGGVGIGGSFNYQNFDTDSSVVVAEGTELTAGDIAIASDSNVFHVGAMLGAGNSDGSALSGMVSLTDSDSYNNVIVDTDAILTAQKDTADNKGIISIDANNDTSVTNAIVTFSASGDNAGVGMGVAINNIDVQNTAQIIDNDGTKGENDELKGEISASELNVNAETTGLINSVSVAGGMTSSGTDSEEGFLDKVKAPYNKMTEISTSALNGINNISNKLQNVIKTMDLNAGAGNGGTTGITSDDAGTPGFSFAGAGSVSLNMVSDTTKAVVDGAKITLNNDGALQVGARDSAFTGAWSGAAGLSFRKEQQSQKSTSVAVSGAVGVNDIDNEITALVKDSTVTGAKDVDVAAVSGGTTVAAGLGLTLTSDSQGGSNYSGGASVSVNLLDKNVNANMDGVTLTGSEEKKAEVDVAAYESDVQVTGGVNANIATGGGSLAGGGVTVAGINNNINAGITGGEYTNVKNVNVKGMLAATQVTAAVSAGVAVGGKSTNNAFTGAAVYNGLSNDINAKIDGANITADGTVAVAAKDTESTSTDAEPYQKMLGDYNDHNKFAADRGIDTTGTSFYDGIDTNGENVDFDGSKGSTIVGAAAVIAGSNGNAAGAAINIADIDNDFTASVNNATVSAGKVLAEADADTLLVGVSGGVAAGTKTFGGMGSVTWQDIDNDLTAEFNNSIITTNEATVKAVNNTQAVNVAGAVAVGKSAGIGATLAYNALDNTIGAYMHSNTIKALGSDVDVTVDADNTGRTYGIAAGVAASSKVAINGSVAVNRGGSNTEAVIDNSENKESNIENAGKVDVTADDETYRIAVVGQVSAAGKAAVGGGVAYNDIADYSEDSEKSSQNTTAAIKNTDITMADSGENTVNVAAVDKSELNTIAVGVAAAANAGVQGSAATSLINKNTSAVIENTNIDENSGSTANVTVDADNNSKITSSADTASVALQGAGVGAGVAVNRIVQQTNAAVNGGTMNVKNLTVDAYANPAIQNIGVGIAAAGQGAGVAGSVSVNMIDNDVTAHIGNGANIVADGNVGVLAASDEQISNYSGMLAAAGQGAGVGISVSVNQIKGETNATVGDAGTDTSITANGDDNNKLKTETNIAETEINNALISSDTVDIDTKIDRTEENRSGLVVDASSTRDMKSFLINIGAAGQGAGVAPTVNINMIEGATKAGITDTAVNAGSSSAGNVFVNAGDYTNMSGFVGSGGIAGMGAGVGLGSDTNTVSRNVSATVDNSDINAGEFEVDAESMQGVSSFVVGAGVGGIGAGVAGVVTVTELENETKAALHNSNVNANKVTVNANHKGIVNAGNVGIGGAGIGAGVGLSVGVLKDDSKTYAEVTSDSEDKNSITATGDVKIAATNTAVVKPSVSATGVAGVGAGVAGATSVNNLNSKVVTNIEGVGITSGGDIEGTAQNNFDVNASMGSQAGGMGGFGVGVTVNTIGSTVQTNVTNSELNAANDIKLTAEETRKIIQTATNIAAGGTAVGANIAITNVGQKVENVVDEDGETISNAADKVNEANNVYGDNASSLLNGAGDALETAQIDASSVTPHVGASDGTENGKVKESQITVNITNSNIAAGNNVTAKATETDNITMTVGGASAGAVAVAAGVGILNVDRNVGVYINGGSITADNTVDVGTDINGEAKIEAYQGSGGAFGANVVYAAVNTTGSSAIDLRNITVEGKKISIAAQDNAKTALQAAGVAAGVVAASALAAEAANDSDVSVNVSSSTITANEDETDGESGAIEISTNKANTVTAQAVNIAGGLIGGAGMGATVSDSGSSTIGLTGNTMQTDNSIDVTANTNSTLSADIVNSGAGWFGSGAVSVAAINAGTADDHMKTAVTIGSGNTFAADDTRFAANSNISESMDMDALAISGYYTAGGNATTSNAYADATVTADANNTYKGADEDEAGDVSFNASNTVTQTADTSGISAAGMFATGTNIGETTTNLTTKVELNGSSADSNIADLNANASSYAAVNNHVNGDGGAIADVSPYAAKVNNNYTADTDVKIGGDWNTAGSFTAQAVNGMDIDLVSDAVRAAVIGGSGTWLANTINNAANVTVDGATITTGGAQNYTAQNTVDYNGTINGSGYGGINVNATDYSDDLDFSAGVDIKESTLHGAGDGGSITAFANTQGNITTKNSLKSAGVIPVALAFSDHAIDYDNRVNVVNSDLTTDKADADITLAATDDTDVELETIADTQGGVAGAASAEASNAFNRGNKINIDADSDLLSTKDINLYAGADANGTKSSLNLQVLADAYNKTAIPVYTDPTVNNSMTQSNQIELAGNAESVRHINASAAKGFTTVTESAKEYKVWTGTGGEGNVASTALGDQIKNETADNYINVTGTAKAGVHNKLDITIDGHSSTAAQPTYEERPLIGSDGKPVLDDEGNPVMEEVLVDKGDVSYKDVIITVDDGEETDWFNKNQITPDNLVVVNGLMERYNQVMEYLAAYAEGSEAYEAYEKEKNLLLTEMLKAGLAERDGNNNIVPLDYIDVPAISLPDIVVSGGNINLETDTLKGSGEITAQGAPQISITNNSDLYLKVQDVTISDNGGNVYLTGNKTFTGKWQEDGTSANTPTITIHGGSGDESQFTQYGNQHPQADIGIFGDITNTAGDVKIINDNYSILVDGNVSGRNIQITATRGNVTQQSSSGVLNVGNDPITKLQFSEAVAEKIQKYLHSLKQDGSKEFKDYTAYLDWLINTVGITLSELGYAGDVNNITGYTKTWNEVLSAVAQKEGLSNTAANTFMEEKKTEGFNAYVSYLNELGIGYKYNAATLNATISEESAGILAGGNIYIDAVNVNIGGLIQSGYGAYSTKLTADDNAKVEDLDKEWQANKVVLTDNDVLGNSKYLINGGGEVYNTDTHVWDYEVKVYYNPSTGQLITESVRPEGGNIQISGKVSSTGGGRIMAMDGTSNVNINTAAVDKDVKVNSITVNDITGLISITDKNVTEDSAGKKVDGWVTEYKNGQWREYAYGTDASSIAWQTGVKDAYKPVEGTQFAWTGGASGEVIREKHYTEDFLFWGALSYNTSEALLDHLEQIGVDVEGTVISSGSSEDPTPMKDGSLITDGYKGGGNMFRIDWTYTNPQNQEEVKATDPTVKKKYDGVAGKIFGYGEYTYTWTETTGDQMASTTGIKADNTIQIGFLGNGEGNGDITVNSGKDMLLNGNISNATVVNDNNDFEGKGSVNLTSNNGSVSAIGSANINSDDVNIRAATGVNVNHSAIGNSANINIATDSGDIKFVSAGGDLNVEQAVTGGINAIDATTGSVYLEAQGNLIDAAYVVNGDYAVKGQRIDLISNTGNIGALNDDGTVVNAFRVLGGIELYSSDTMASSVNAQAEGDIVLTQADGNMRLGTIVSENGDAVLTVNNGSFVDAHSSENNDNSSAQDKIDRWIEAGLISAQDDANSSANAAKEAKEERMEALDSKADALAYDAIYDDVIKPAVEKYQEAADAFAKDETIVAAQQKLQDALLEAGDNQEAIAAANAEYQQVVDNYFAGTGFNETEQNFIADNDTAAATQYVFDNSKADTVGNYKDAAGKLADAFANNADLQAAKDTYLNSYKEASAAYSAEVAAAEAAGASDAEIAAIGEKYQAQYEVITNEYLAAQAEVYGDSFTAEEQQLISSYAEVDVDESNYGWSKNQLLYAIQDTVLNSEPGTVQTVETPNVTANNITLNAANGGVGIDGEAEVIDYADLNDEASLKLLAQAKAGDLTWDEKNQQVTIRQQQAITVSVNEKDDGTYGNVDVTGKDNVYLAGVSGTELNINGVTTNGDIRLQGDEGVNVDGTLTGVDLTIAGGSGDIKGVGDDNYVNTAISGTLDANADGSIYINQIGNSDLKVLAVATKGLADIRATNNILMSDVEGSQAQGYINAKNLNLTAGGSIGTDGTNVNAIRILDNGVVVDAKAKGDIVLAGVHGDDSTGSIVLGDIEGANLDVTSISNINLGRADNTATEDDETVNSDINAGTVVLTTSSGSITETEGSAVNAETVKATATQNVLLASSSNAIDNFVVNGYGTGNTLNGYVDLVSTANNENNVVNVEFGKDVDGSTVGLTVNDGYVKVNSLGDTSNLNISGGSVTTTGENAGNVIFTSEGSITADTEVNSAADIVMQADGAITNTGALTAQNNVNVNTTEGAINIGGSVTATDNDVNITTGSGAISTTGAISGGTNVKVDAGTTGTIDLGGDVTAEGGDVVVTTDDGYINTTGAVTANNDVNVDTLNGAINLGGLVDAETGFVNVSTANGSITTGGYVSGHKDVTLNSDGGDITVDGYTESETQNVTATVKGDGNISFAGTVSASGDVEAEVTGKGDITTGTGAEVSGTDISFTTNEGNITTGSDLTADKNVDLNVNTGNITFGGDVTANEGNITIDITGDGNLKDAENRDNTLTAISVDGSEDAGNIIIHLGGKGDVDLYDLYATNNARLDIQNGNLTLHEIDGELVAMQLRSEGKDMNVDKITAGTQIVLNGSDMSLDDIAQRPDADGMLVVTPNGAADDKPIDNFTIGNITTNTGSGIRFDHLWVNNSDIHIDQGQLWFDKLYVENAAHFSNNEMVAAIYGVPPLRDGSDSVYWNNTAENRPEDNLDMWLNGSGDWMYLRFTDDHIQESNGILLTLDQYDYVYDQRFTAEDHLRWQHGRYLDEDWKQAYGYGLSLHNRYGLIDYQEFTETNAGADEVAVEA